MTDDSTRPDEPYQELVDYSWTVRAFAMLESDDLHGEVISRDEIISSRVWGSCPRCRHALDDRQTHTAVTNLMEGRGRGAAPGDKESGPAFFDVDVSCDCGNSHPGAPPGTTGCGVSFRVELPVRTVGQL